MDLGTYLSINVLKTFAETLDIRYHQMDATVVTLSGIGIVGAGVIVLGTGVGLCVAELKVSLVLSLLRAMWGMCT